MAHAKRIYDAALLRLGYMWLSAGRSSLGYGEKSVTLWIGAAERPVPRDDKSGLHCFERADPDEPRCLPCGRA